MFLLGRFGSANVGGEVSLLFRREERGNGDVSKDIRLDKTYPEVYPIFTDF